MLLGTKYTRRGKLRVRKENQEEREKCMETSVSSVSCNRYTFACYSYFCLFSSLLRGRFFLPLLPRNKDSLQLFSPHFVYCNSCCASVRYVIKFHILSRPLSLSVSFSLECVSGVNWFSPLTVCHSFLSLSLFLFHSLGFPLCPPNLLSYGSFSSPSRK